MKPHIRLSCFFLTLLGIVLISTTINAQESATHTFRIYQEKKHTYELNKDSKLAEIHIINESDCESFEILIGKQKLPVLKKGKNTFKFSNLEENAISIINQDDTPIAGEFPSSFDKANLEVLAGENCPVKSGQIEKKSNTDKSQTNSETCNESVLLYIPTGEQEQQFVKNEAFYAKTKSEECCPGTYELIFDYQAQ